MVNVSAPKRRRNNFDFAAKRRQEIVRHARHVGAADTEDFSRWLIAWVWHNRKAKDQIWSVMECAKNMGGKITEAEASAITEEASITRKHLSADNLARFLGVTYEQRQALGLTTIGSINVKKRARKELRKRRDKLNKERKRLAAGARPQSQSLSRTQPWRELGVSRAAWYRRNKQRTPSETTSSTPIFLSSEDEPVSPEGRQGRPSGPTDRSKQEPASTDRSKQEPASSKQGDLRLATATALAADRYGTLPLELRLAALCLPLSDELRRAA
jgi:hypothetical protein